MATSHRSTAHLRESPLLPLIALASLGFGAGGSPFEMGGSMWRPPRKYTGDPEDREAHNLRHSQLRREKAEARQARKAARKEAARAASQGGKAKPA